MSIKELLDRYVEIGVAQDNASLDNDTNKFNQLFDKKTVIEKELQIREGDQRTALMTLYEHPNMQVRLNAAKATLAVAPSQARQLLQKIADSNFFPQAGDAGMSLWNLERGVYKPK